MNPFTMKSCSGAGALATGVGKRFAAAFIGGAVMVFGARVAGGCVLGMISGAGVFVAGYHVLEPLALSLGDWGKVTVPGLLDVSPSIVIATLAVLIPLLLRWISRPPPRGADRRRHIRGTPDRGRELATSLPG